MLEVYRTFVEDWMAMPVLTGRKSDGEQFPVRSAPTAVKP